MGSFLKGLGVIYLGFAFMAIGAVSLAVGTTWYDVWGAVFLVGGLILSPFGLVRYWVVPPVRTIMSHRRRRVTQKERDPP